MKNKFSKKLKNLKYALPFAAAGLFTQAANGQDNRIWFTYFPLPTEPINMFISPDDTPQAVAYNALTTKEARDAVMPEKVTNDITSKVQGLVCNKSTVLFTLNSKNFGKDLYTSTGLIYEGYDDENFDSILLHGGTTKYFGTLGIPAGMFEITDVKHQSNYVITGNKVNDAKSYNMMEAAWPWAATNVQPGEVYIPRDADTLMIYYTYIYKNAEHEKNIAHIPVVWFKIKDGQYEFVATNPNVNIIMERESDKPIIKVEESAPDSLIWNIIEKNFKNAQLIIDGKTPTTIAQNGKIKLNELPGTHTIKIIANDYFRLSSDTTFQRIITGQINPPGIIQFISPTNNQIIDKSNIDFEYNIIDTDFKSATYKINNQSAVSIGKSGKIPLILPNGLYKIVLEEKDAVQTVKDSVTFEIKKPITINSAPTINRTSPIDGKEYTTDIINLQYNITDKENDPITASYKINNETPITTGTSVTKQLKLTNGLYTIIIEASDPEHTGTNSTKDTIKIEVNKPTGIEPGPSLEKLIVYPNPTDGYINIKGDLPLPGTTTATVYGINGQKLREIKTGAIRETIEDRIDIGDMARGIYFLKIETTATNGQTYKTTKKIIKDR